VSFHRESIMGSTIVIVVSVFSVFFDIFRNFARIIGCRFIGNQLWGARFWCYFRFFLSFFAKIGGNSEIFFGRERFHDHGGFLLKLEEI
jgi:hypothetical protein